MILQGLLLIALLHRCEANPCGTFALDYANQGYTASDACCNCCGGLIEESECRDVVLFDGTPWYDSDGPVYTCEWYSSFADLTTTPSECDITSTSTTTQNVSICGDGIIEYTQIIHK